MPALAFDTHAYVKKLRDAGVPEAQAEIQVEAIVEVIEARMTTKQDLDLQEAAIQREIAGLKRDIKELDVKLQREIAGLKRDIKELDVKLETRLRELDVRLERDIAGLRRDIKELDVKLETRLKELEMRLLIRLGGLFVVGIGAIATLIKLL